MEMWWGSPGVGWQLTGINTGTGHSKAVGSPSLVNALPGHVTELPALTPAWSKGWSKDPCTGALPRLSHSASSTLPLFSTWIKHLRFTGQPWCPAAEFLVLVVLMKLRLNRSFGTWGTSGSYPTSHFI